MQHPDYAVQEIRRVAALGCRVALVRPMDAMGNCDRPALVRVDDAKNNLTAGSPNAVWFKLIGVDLNNKTDLYPNGDNVQTVERWYPPHAFAKLDLSTIERILERIDKGPYKGGRYV